MLNLRPDIKAKLNRFFIFLCACSIFVLTVAVSRAYQTRKDIDTIRDKMEVNSQQISIESQRISELDRRRSEEDQKKLPDRVMRLETLAETNHDLLVAVAISIGVLMIETTLRLIMGNGFLRKKEESRG